MGLKEHFVGEKIIDLVIETNKKLSPGESTQVVCPGCGGKLMIEKSSYNGHVHAFCTGCEFALIE